MLNIVQNSTESEHNTHRHIGTSTHRHIDTYGLGLGLWVTVTGQNAVCCVHVLLKLRDRVCGKC